MASLREIEVATEILKAISLNWKRTIKINGVAISYYLFGTLNKTHDKVLEAAAKKYKSFLW